MNGLSADRRDFIRHPTNRVIGTVGDAGHARDAIAALLRAGFTKEEIDVLHGDEDVQRLDPIGAEHGFFAQFQRTFIRTFDLDEFKHLTHLVEDVRAGRFVIMVLTKRRGQRIVAADILHQYGAEFVGFYGRWAWTDLPATGHNSPADVPALFVQALNARDADALASLFDDDAEFVHVSGRCWHNRESIRRELGARLGTAPGASVLVPGETKVKLLSPEVAVVHARMTFEPDAQSDGASSAPPRTTIISFVVHRAGERWLCASAQHTDLADEPETRTLAAGQRL